MREIESSKKREMAHMPPRWPREFDLWSRIGASGRSVLMLDYDGTLAPFRKERLEAYPYPGVPERLARLAALESVRLVLVSGRPARELLGLLTRVPRIGERVEIWGDHGQERLRSDGSYSLRPVGEEERRLMDAVKEEVARLGLSGTVEAKPASLAIHWRGLDPQERDRINSAVRTLYRQQGERSDLRLLEFDGGIELRSKHAGKDAAVEQILAEEESGIIAAYLGDDLTDEDAFAAAGDRALSILVRIEPRESSARFWLKPPEELLEFLDSWVQAAGARSRRKDS